MTSCGNVIPPGSPRLPRDKASATAHHVSPSAARLSDEALEAAQAKARNRNEAVGQFVSGYRQYCWPVQSLDDFKLAPFHLLATEGKVHTDRNHVWHMMSLAKICVQDSKLLLATEHRTVDVTDPASERSGIDWWTELTARGGEGMVVKPMEFIVRGPKGLVVSCGQRLYHFRGHGLVWPRSVDRGLGVSRRPLFTSWRVVCTAGNLDCSMS